MDTNSTHTTPTALVTGASRGLGAAIARLLAADGWHLIIDGRDGTRLDALATELGTGATAVPGDVTDPAHRAALIDAAIAAGGLDLLIDNASELGPSPLPTLDTVPIDALRRIFDVNVVAPVALIQSALPLLAARHGAVIDITSDAAAEAYSRWGGYGASKAALEHVDRVLVAELAEAGTDVRVWTLDPGDMRTDMHQAAFPGEDISDRADPNDIAPVVAHLVATRPPSGRLRASDLILRSVS